ncbi:hypothetical protein REC12_20325 [Desulfosporosinus sp. PR]|uniref:hypothetical protein n=1 Tax=Candidatus Desulfosporosinus nitrosoreducens TaxID=3401928 RepID=UPI0027ED10DD|nr:hypothetical protein [Desulfosporosinus sp. PR]MDQ7095944.1 hypothetical protein [Desulfosporosinus sp. PR]
MNYKKLIKDALTPLGIPVEFQKYSGTSSVYITFFCYNEQGEAWAENDEIATGYYVQVDIWSKSDYSTLEEQVLGAMQDAGFYRKTSQDFYEEDTKIYHKAMRFVYVV